MYINRQFCLVLNQNTESTNGNDFCLSCECLVLSNKQKKVSLSVCHKWYYILKNVDSSNITFHLGIRCLLKMTKYTESEEQCYLIYFTIAR